MPTQLLELRGPHSTGGVWGAWQGSLTPSLESSKEHPQFSQESAWSNIQSDCKREDGPNSQEVPSQR